MSTDADHWELLQTLYHLIKDVPEADRGKILTEACPDHALRERALAILHASERVTAEPPTTTPAFNRANATWIGPYVVRERLGSGGIGTVYLVERDAAGVRQRAAIKVLSPHATSSSLERFHKEQQILASLDHPNITRMLDAGFDENSQPYLVMEYVDGQHLDAYCDERQLSIEDRLRLFVKVCEAVDYAHRNLVVHLDLKPSNILVTMDGTPKLLDFGTSKLISNDGHFTTTLSVTPSYASPEQLRNEAVTTACDVYSLGVILYELLAGHRPTGDASMAALIERAVEEKDPASLDEIITVEAAAKRGLTRSRLRSLLAGDLSTIVRKCLNTRPLERYPSVNALAEDVQRYLSARPVLAQRQTTLYYLRKFARRNSGKVAASVIMLLAVVASLSVAWWQQHQALREGQRAMRMQTFLYRLFKMANSNYTGKPAATVREFLELGIKVLPEYIRDPSDLRQAQLALAESMFENRDFPSARKVFTQVMESSNAAGDVPAEAEATTFAGNTAYLQGDINLGRTLTARALELSRKPGIPPRTRALSAIYYAINRDNNGERADENVKLLEFAVRESRHHNFPPHETAEALFHLADDLQVRGRVDEAEPIFEEALQLYRQDPLALCDQSDIYYDLAYIRENRGKIDESVRLFRQAYEGYKTCSGAEDRETLRMNAYWAGALVRAGRATEALPILENALPLWRKAFEAGNPVLAEELYFLALAYLETRHYPEAERAAKEEVEVQAGKIAPNDRRIGAGQLIWGHALAGQERYREALPHAETANRILAGALTPRGKKTDAEARALLNEVRSKLSMN